MKAHRPIFAALSVLAGAMVPATAGAQDFNRVEREARSLRLEQRGPFGGLSEIGALSRFWSVNTFYTVFRGDYPSQTVFWVIRRETGDMEGSKTVAWADSRSCPMVETVLIAMEQLPLVRPDAIRLGVEPETMGLIMDGTAHRFWNDWARSGPDDASVALEISGNINSPIALWWAEAIPRLADCWVAEPPR